MSRLGGESPGPRAPGEARFPSPARRAPQAASTDRAGADADADARGDGSAAKGLVRRWSPGGDSRPRKREEPASPTHGVPEAPPVGTQPECTRKQMNLPCTLRCLRLRAKPHSWLSPRWTTAHVTPTSTGKPRSMPTAPVAPAPPQPAERQRVPARPAAPPLPSASDPPGQQPQEERTSPMTPGARRSHRGARGASRLPPPRAPYSTRRRPGAPRRSLATTHSPATRPAQTGRRPHVPAGTGRARVCRCVLRCHWDQNGRCSPGPPGAARFPPITACYAPPSTFTHARTRRSQRLFLLLPRPEEEVLENQNSVEGEGAEEEGTAVAGERVPLQPLTHTSVCCVWQTPGVHGPVCFERRGRAGRRGR